MSETIHVDIRQYKRSYPSQLGIALKVNEVGCPRINLLVIFLIVESVACPPARST
jgi:hypothetical protein